MSEKEDLNVITETIIKCAFNVSNTLGAGFLEKVYENSLMKYVGAGGQTFLSDHINIRGSIVVD